MDARLTPPTMIMSASAKSAKNIFFGLIPPETGDFQRLFFAAIFAIGKIFACQFFPIEAYPPSSGFGVVQASDISAFVIFDAGHIDYSGITRCDT